VQTCIRFAAAGDIHASEADRDQLERAFSEAGRTVDLVLLAGDLTTHGEPEEARVLADVCSGLETPVVAVLGNHDHHAGREDEVAAALEEGGVIVLRRDHTVLELQGVEVGIAGTKGFVGGFPGSALPDFGEPLLRQVYRETTAEADALAAGLQGISHCPLRVVLLHYAPIPETLAGEPPGIFTYLGSGRLAQPIAEHPPDVVLHGHAHAGTFEGRIGDVPVYNVAMHVTGRDFYVFGLEVSTPGHPAVEVEAGPV
jgi:Icc-related predicted phosphoesterase